MAVKYMILLRRYDGVGKPLVRGMSGFSTITKARAYAYKLLDHKSEYNNMGIYKAEIISDYNGNNGQYRFHGEVQNTAYDERYWYPPYPMVVSQEYKHRKYILHKDGTLGKGMR